MKIELHSLPGAILVIPTLMIAKTKRIIVFSFGFLHLSIDLIIKRNENSYN